ncbi:DNA-dependent protein kinase catalytic subunit [Diachasma alloeum]|uniref:DNA-dependent protein kinase catalytic subunit n=1 Tax=Diachasma alloeum TaxID=454923 RepID=UPI0007383C89|nr:DNA-dependent protein kinase catalytic subunit [Diachasma alloeum]
MESADEFVEIFMRNWREGNDKELARLFKEGPRYFRNLSSAEIGLLLEGLLDKKALPKYLHDSLDQLKIPTDTESALREGFTLLKYLLSTFPSLYQPYLQTTFEICEFGVKLKIPHHTKRSACQALMTLIRVFPDYTSGLNDFTSFYTRRRHLYKKTEYPMILQVLCTIARHHPDLPAVSSNGQRQQLRVFEDFNEACNSTTGGITNVEMAINSLTDVLHNFPFPGPVLARDFYDQLKSISPAAAARGRGLIESILLFLREHLQKFESFILEDHDFWHSFLQRLLQNEFLAPLVTETLKVYYEVLADVLKRDNSSEALTILHNLQETFVNALTNAGVTPQNLRISIMGYSQLAEPLKRLVDEAAVNEMFSLISRRILPLYFTEDDEIQFEDIADYQEALARVLPQLSVIADDHIRILMKMCILMIKRFPELKPKARMQAGESLKRTIEHMSHLKVHLFEEFLSNVVYEGVVWSCSHSLLIDVELKHLENPWKRLITYKDYIPLWQSLLSPENYTMNNQEKVCNQLLTTCISLTSKLDVRIKTREDNVFSDIGVSQVPENEDDFRIFLNLVDLYEELLPKIIESSEDVKKLLESLITTSSKHPLVSGFYRLVRRSLSASQSFTPSETLLILNYLRRTLKLVFELSHELQISCIQLILHSPKDFTKDLLPHIGPVFTLAFRIGLNNYELADSALEDLERFVTCGDEEPVRTLLLEVLPTLEVYLRSKESLELHEDSKSPVQRTARTESALGPLQNKILLFFGRISNSVMLEFLHKQSQNTGGTWDRKNLLEYTMTFPDGDLPVHLDTILPRIIDLSLCCSDVSTRISACEALHSIVIIILGKTVYYISNEPERYASFYKTLCPVLLKLGCDPDQVIRQIFNPLMLQMTHWLSSRLMLHSPVIGFLMECIFEGLCNSDSSIKDFSGICLAEFSRWSIKQATDTDLRRIPVNIHNVVENIKNFALHPLKNRKVAAAIAFNHIYKILRENEEIVDIFWLEFLQCFVEAMEHCGDARIRGALNHVVRVLSEKPGIFRECSARRRVPRCFGDGNLKSCVEFLLNHCISLDEAARRKCMKLYERLNDKIEDHEQYLKIQTVMLTKLEVSGVGAGEGVRRFTATLDVYVWLLQGGFIDPQVLLVDSHPQNVSIFSAIEKFIARVNRDGLDEPAAVIKLIEFMVEVLGCRLSSEEEVHDVLFNEEFCTLISRCVRQPEALGFNVKYLEMAQLLPRKIERLVESLVEHLSKERLQSVFRALNFRFDDLSVAMNHLDLNSTQRISLQNKLKCLIFMKRCKLLETLQLNEKILQNNLLVIGHIFAEVRIFDARRYWCRELAPDVKLHYEGLLELSLDDEGFASFVRSRGKQIDELLECDGKSQMTHGEYFIITFRDVIIRYLLRNIDTSLEMMVNLSRQFPDFVLFVMNETATWLQRHRKDHRRSAEEFCDAAISSFQHFRRASNNFETRKKLLKNIYRTAVRLKQDLINIKVANKEMYYWIIEEFQGSASIPEKTQILNDFLVCLLTESDENTELRVIFRSFDIPEVPEGSDGLLKRSLKSAEVLEYFQTLMAALPITKSLVILEAVTICAMKLGKCVSTKSTSDHLAAYFSLIPRATALESLQRIHKMILDPSFPGRRPDVLRYFFLPVFKYCEEDVVHDFFERNIKELVMSLTGELPGNPEDRRLMVITWIEAFSLLEVMFSTLSIDRINGPIARRVSEVTRSSSDVFLQLYKKTLDVRTMPVNPSEKFLMRLLHCAAFNCGITMVSVSNEEKYLLGLFGENAPLDKIIWKKIIDCSKNYSLTQTFKELPKQRDVLVNIRKTMTMRETSSSHSYLRSYNLASSTLTEDIGAYDMHTVIPLAEPSTSRLLVTLESDDLNDHECMAPIVGVLKYLSEIHPCDPDKPPPWFKYFAGAMSIGERNVKLFLLKIVLNTQEVFKPFAGLLLKRIVRMISFILRSTISIGYIIADALLMLVDWSEVSVPGEDSKGEANEMFDLLVNKVVAQSSSEAIVKYNYSIVDMLVKAWHQVLEPPSCLGEKMSRMPEGAARLILSLLQNDLGPRLVNDPRVLQFLLKSLEDWRRKEEVLLQISAAIGLFLKFSAPLDPDGQQREEATRKIRLVFRAILEPNRLIKAVHAMCTAFPGLLYEFYQFVTHNHLKLSFSTKVKSMEMFLLRIPQLTDQEVHQEIVYIKFQDLLDNKVLSCEKICLEIILSLAKRLRSETLLPLARLAANYANHETLAYRTLVYDIFVSIFKHYIDDISKDQSGETLVDLSQRILLSGLLDPSESLQQKCMSFWTEEAQFRTNCSERILDILGNYSPELAQNFLPIFGILFLNLSKKSPNYESKLFIPLDKDCNYRNYKIATSWRMKNLSYRVPLFIPSYASQCSQRFTMSILSSDDFTSTNEDLMVRATNPLEFEPTIAETFLAEENPSSSAASDVFVVPATPSRFSRRFVARQSSSSKRYQALQPRQDSPRSQTMRQTSSIRLSRGYRIGELPDIEITHETVLNPLQELIKKDPLICKNLMISIICSVMKKLQSHREVEKRRFYVEFTGKVSKMFEMIFRSQRGDGLTIAAAMEVILKNPDLSFTPTIVSQAAKATGLEVLGALLIEKRLMAGPESGESSSKRSRLLEEVGNTVEEWVNLGELYESINDHDIFLSVFRNHVPGEELNAASSARCRNSWEEARSHYEEAIVKEKGAIRRHCRRGLLECLARLSDWEQISSYTLEVLGENQSLLQLLAVTGSSRHSWMIPWYFKSRIYQIFVDSNSAEMFSADLMAVTSSEEGRRLVEDRFTEELAVLHSTKMNEHARALVLTGLRKTKDRWSQLSPLSVQLRLQEVVKLRGLCDTRLYRDALADLRRGTSAATEDLIDYWERSFPIPQDDFLPWDIHLAQRTHMTNVLKNKISESEHLPETLSPRLSTLEVLQKMAFIKSSYLNRNPVLMAKYMVEVKDSIPDMTPDIQTQFELNKIQIKFLRGQLGSDEAKMKNLRVCKEKSEELLIIENISIDAAIENLQLMADWSLEMLVLRDSDEEMFNRIISKLIESSSYLPTGLQLEDYPLDRFKRAIGLVTVEPTPKRLQDSHLKTLKYCHTRIVDGTDNEEIRETFIESTLKAINYGCNEAMNYFPSLLKENYLRDYDMRYFFMELTNEIPSWKFLRWQPQLFIHLSSTLRQTVAPIIERLADDYPNALFYSLQSTLDSSPELQDNPTIQKLLKKFEDRSDLRDFVEALEYLVRPELLLKYYLDDLVRNLHLGRHTVVDRLLKRVYHPSNPSMRGDLYKYISPFENQVVRIREMPQGEVGGFVETLKSQLDASLRKHKDSNRLRDYSPYLSQINDSALEVPGLYSGESCPDPGYRPRIMKIEGKVQVMNSARKPIRITIVGDDTKSYKFLVKFGEDLRVDQRLQQTFNVMNEVLRADLCCSQRNLSIKTFKVIPLSSRLGLIEWIENARTLQEFITFTWSDAQKNYLQVLDRDYEGWIGECSTGEGKRAVKYRDAVLKRSAEETIRKMSSLIAKTDSAALRRTFEVISPSAESFVSFRRNFVTSYSVMCVAQWILGIGDRHLENTMVGVESGECTGIDFASAFGGGIDQSVPELMPFRLTKQILKLVEPFDEGDLVSETMEHALRAMRSNRGLISGVLGVIIHEKLNWFPSKRKFECESREEGAEIDWMPRWKLEVVMRKLKGDHPSEVMVDELRGQHCEAMVKRYEAIIRGTDSREKSLRSRLRGTGLSSREQLQCLLEQATDLNVLGRTYVGWRPYL